MKTLLDPLAANPVHSRIPATISLPDAARLDPPLAAEDHARTATDIPRWKRVLDITCILLALPGLLLLMGCIAVFIRWVSPGPILFKQERVGYRRRCFSCLKFRTMKIGADTASHRAHFQQLQQSGAAMKKLDAAGDPRLIRFGAVLRATGLDELPQLINVWRGEMSLVGPRPCLPYELEGYRPWQYARFDTLPGLTGLWQVSGKNQTTFAEMITLDIRYARSKSLWLDLGIMARTVAVPWQQVKETFGRPPLTGLNPARSNNPATGLQRFGGGADIADFPRP